MTRFISMLAALLMLPLAAAAGQLTLELHPKARIDGRSVRLGDLAAVSAADPTEVARMRALVLGPAPQPGYADALSRARIAQLLRRHGVRGELLWGGAATVAVEAVGQPLAGKTLAEAAVRALRAQLHAAGYRAEVALEHPLPDLTVPAGEVVVRPADQPALPRSRMSVRVEVTVDGAFFAAVQVPLRVRAYAAVPVARRVLAGGTVLVCGDVDSAEWDVAALPSAPAAMPCPAGGVRLRARIEPGQPLLAALLQPVPDVAQGQAVELRLEDGPVVLESRAVALADAARGQSVPVRPAYSSESVLAEVTGPGKVSMRRNQL